MLKPLIVGITTNWGKHLKRWESQTTLPVSWEISMQVKKQQLELDMEQRTGSKLEKEYIKAVYYHPDYLTYMQSTSWEMLGWRKLKLGSRFPGEISITSDMRWHHPYGRKWRRTKEPHDEDERKEWKSWLKTQHSKKWKKQQQQQRSWHLVPSLHGKQKGKQQKQQQTLFFLAPKSLLTVTATMQLKDACFLEE